MRSLPRSAQLYLLIVCLAGIAAVCTAWRLPAPAVHAPRWELALFFILSALAGSKKITLARNRHGEEDDTGSMSPGFALMFAALLRFGPSAGLATGIVCIFSASVYPKRHAAHHIAFNVALTAIESWAMGVVFVWLNGGTLALRPVETFFAVVGAVLVNFVVNTGGVSFIIALCSGQKPIPLWRQTFLWTAPSYFAGAFVSTLVIFLFRENAGIVLLFTSPIAWFIYQSYATYIAREEKQRHIEEKQKHIEELQLSQEQLSDLYLATIKSLALAIDAKDQYTHQHIVRVQRYAVAIAEQMGLTGPELKGVNTGALLHDIGKLGVPEYILLKPGRLTDEEFAKIKKHPEIGAAILDPVDFPWPVLSGVKYHHEKWDGTGYPEGLAGTDIPLTARILAVADVYDALTSSRSYRKAWTHERALAAVQQDSGTHFDPDVVAAFTLVIDGVVQAMAVEGDGPLVARRAKMETPRSKMEKAAQDIQLASSELWALYEVAQTLSSSLGLQETIDILARKLEAIFPQSACLFLLRDGETEPLTVRAAVGVNRAFFAGGKTLGDDSRSFQVARLRQTYLGEYDQDDLLLTGCETEIWTALHTALIVPIVHQGETLGTINLYHAEPDAFHTHDRQLLETIGERSAMALYNGLLFDRTRSHANTDPLTGLYNFRYLTECVEARCRQQNEERGMMSDELWSENHMRGTQETAPDREPDLILHPRTAPIVSFALLCLDLDSFKPINDNFGHQKGDQVLRDLARIFRAEVSDADLVARYGGDEFLIVLEGADETRAQELTERLQAAVEGYDAGLIHYKLGVLRLGVSIGWACFPQEGPDFAALLSAADARMYRHKTERKLGSLANRAA